MKYLINLALAFFMSFSAFASNTNKQTESIAGIGRYYVGADNACDFSSIQSAINATIGNMNAPEIFIASNMTYEENLVINGVHMFMEGGYSNCSNARNGVGGGNRTAIIGSPGSTLPIIRVQGSSGSSFQYFVTIKNIILRDNNLGGLRTFTSSAIIRLQNMTFTDLGGSALRVQGTSQASTDVIVENSIFVFNSATNGGAIRCAGLNNSIILDGSTMAANTATGNGGGVYLEQACDFSMSGGGFGNNTTDGNGGAIYAEFGSDVILEQTSLDSNTAVLNGGAIFAIDGFTTINAEAVRFRNNRSTSGSGGAIAVHNGASFTIKRTAAECADMDRCNFFDGNEAPYLAGAIYNDNSNIDISSTYFEENRSNFGTAIYVIGANSTTKIEGSIFNNNGDNGAHGFTDLYVVRAIQEADMTITYSTFADNNAETATLGVSFNSRLDLFSSIVYDFTSGDVIDREGTGLLNKDCIIVHGIEGFEFDGDFVIARDPVFINPNNRDYHLNAALSPAVDACNNVQGQAVFKDIDFQDRGFDDILIINHPMTNGTFDIGADETQGSDIIFKDGFE